MPHRARAPVRPPVPTSEGLPTMWLLIGEALLAGGLLVFIVWWTMFSGRRSDDDPPGRGPDAGDDDTPR